LLFAHSLPDILDVVALFKRPDNQIQTMCPKSTMLFPTFAQYLIDSFIITETKPGPDGKVIFDWAKTRSPHDISITPLYGRKVEQTTALRLKSSKPGEKGRLKSQMIDGEEWCPFLWKADGTFTDIEFKHLETPQGLDHIMQYVAVDEDKVREYRTKIFAVGGERTNVSAISKASVGTGL
jgi:prostaglandin-endoperoxide synthase 2